MDKLARAFVLLVLVSGIAVAEDSGADEVFRAYWGFSGSIEMAGMFLDEGALQSVYQQGYGTVGTSSGVVLFTAGVNYRRPRVVDLALSISYLGGGSFDWDDLFGDYGNSFNLYADSFAAQIEIQPLFAWLHGIHPFIGGGYAFTNGLVDDIGEGFVGGDGPFVVGGLYILNSFGLTPMLENGDKVYAGIRISLYYRLPYAYGFDIDWTVVEGYYSGTSDFSALRSFFEGASVPARGFAFGVGLGFGYAPFAASRKTIREVDR